MKIRRFVAADMRSALQLVRAAHGPDAVILSNRRTDEGVEIVAASNYDEAFVQRAIEATRPEPAEVTAPPAVAPAAAPPAAASAAAPALTRSERWLQALSPDAGTAAAAAAPPPRGQAAPATAGTRAVFPLPDDVVPAAGDTAQPVFAELLAASQAAPEAPPPAAVAQGDGNPSPAPMLAAVPDPPAAASDGELTRMREELSQMRQMIEREMVRLTDERLRGSPVRAQVMGLMEDYGFDAGITREVALQIPADTQDHKARGLMLGLISKRLPICPVDPLHEGGVIALVGPTGAGKTTTIAKLAALYASRHQPRDVALVTTDTMRVGGREQLYGHGRQLGIAVHEADSEAGLLQLLQRLQDYRLVLVDTAGMSQRDRALAGQLNWLRAARQVRTLLTLPANTHFSDLNETVRRFQGVRPHGVVLTKLDETGRLGSALSVVAEHELPLTWTTDGQSIPEDLTRANAAHLVLRLEDLRRDADKPPAPEYHDAIA